MGQLTGEELAMIGGAVVFAVIFFIVTSFGIYSFLKRLERQDKKYHEDNPD